MHVEVQTPRITPTEALLNYTHHRLGASLHRLSHAIDSVVLRISHMGGTRAGANRRCRVVVRLASGGQFVLEDVHSDVYRAVDRVADRARRTVVRRLSRLRNGRRRG